MERNIIILGSGPGYDTAPTDRETWAVGKMLMLEKPPTRVDLLFALDDMDHLLTIRRGMFTKQQFIDKINERNVTYFSSVKHPEIPLSAEYPLADVLSIVKVPYFQNTICYMIAYALFQRVNSISLYGVAQMGTHEYMKEKGCVEFWLGLAMGMGVQVNIETPSLLLRDGSEYLYGYVNTITELKKQGRI